ncbi:MAG: class I SAM-dependent methyltransferase [Deltaproteobacteria bacterium]
MLTAARDIAGLVNVFFRLKIAIKIDRAESPTGYSDLQALYLAARDGWGEGAVVEIGSFKGKSSIALAFGSMDKGREEVYCVDPHVEGTKEAFFRNIRDARADSQIVPVIAPSEEAVRGFDRPIRFIFIDGNHEYEFVRKDIALWKDKVIDGGVLAFHDYTFPGVRKAIGEMTGGGGYTVETATGCTLYVSKGNRRNARLFETIDRFNRIKNCLFFGKRPIAKW